MKVDFFCQIIDNYGDLAVGLRLAIALKKNNPSWIIRFFCDNNSILPKLFPLLKNTEEQQTYGQVEIYGRYENHHPTKDIDVAIELLACNLPENYPPPPLVINLEYLSAEGWTTSFHLKQSYISRTYLKYFFLPGVLIGTGGLVWGGFIEKLAFANIDRENQRHDFLAHIGQSQLNVKKTWVSIYSYQISSYIFSRNPDVLFFILDDSEEKFPSNVVKLQLGLDDYDWLVTLCDFNAVRGEDSLSRALLTGKPFIWQAYKQKDDAHWPKISAILSLFRVKIFDSILFCRLEAQFRRYQSEGYFDLDFFLKYKTDITEATREMAKNIINLGSQEQNLAFFIEQTLKINKGKKNSYAKK